MHQQTIEQRLWIPTYSTCNVLFNVFILGDIVAKMCADFWGKKRIYSILGWASKITKSGKNWNTVNTVRMHFNDHGKMWAKESWVVLRKYGPREPKNKLVENRVKMRHAWYQTFLQCTLNKYSSLRDCWMLWSTPVSHWSTYTVYIYILYSTQHHYFHTKILSWETGTKNGTMAIAYVAWHDMAWRTPTNGQPSLRKLCNACR